MSRFFNLLIVLAIAFTAFAATPRTGSRHLLPPNVVSKFAPGCQPHFVTYLTRADNGTRMMDNIVLLKIEDEHNATLYNLYADYDSIHVNLDIDAGTISIWPAIVELDTYWYQIDRDDPTNNLWICSYDTENNTFSTTEPITGTIADDGSITLSSCGFYTPKTDRSEGAYSKAEFVPGNAKITHQYTEHNYKGEVIGTYTSIQPAHIIQTSDSTLRILDFDNTESDIDITLFCDSTVEMPQQTVFIGQYLGNATYRPIDYSSSTDAIDGPITGYGVPGQIILSGWGQFLDDTDTYPVMGAITSVITYDEGVFTYPKGTSAVTDVATAAAVKAVEYYSTAGQYLGTTPPATPGIYIEVKTLTTGQKTSRKLHLK